MNQEKAIKIFKALGEETRFLIVKELLNKELCACEIPLKINRTQSNTSMHLSKLHDLGIVESRREGKSIIYSVKDKDVIKIMSLIENKNICVIDQKPKKRKKRDNKNIGNRM